MHLLLNTALPLIFSLLTTQASAELETACGKGTFNKRPNSYTRMGNCDVKPKNVYSCGNTGTSVVHTKNQIYLLAGSSDATVLVTCGGKDHVLRCVNGYAKTFIVHACKGGVQSVSNVKEDPYPPGPRALAKRHL
ncbi:hypothetical protein Vi05172_g4342 [Venturia inaequalis]|nr:hypothetical protein Vi05172_g4342 [Venturia inaequalis]